MPEIVFDTADEAEALRAARQVKAKLDQHGRDRVTFKEWLQLGLVIESGRQHAARIAGRQDGGGFNRKMGAFNELIDTAYPRARRAQVQASAETPHRPAGVEVSLPSGRKARKPKPKPTPPAKPNRFKRGN